MSHTPGPWEAVRTSPSGVKFYIHHKSEHTDGGYFGSVEAMHLTDEALDTCAANASLIAAAPELLEACREAEIVLEGHSDRTPNWHKLRRKAFANIRAAIAKAEGQE